MQTANLWKGSDVLLNHSGLYVSRLENSGLHISRLENSRLHQSWLDSLYQSWLNGLHKSWLHKSWLHVACLSHSWWNRWHGDSPDVLKQFSTSNPHVSLDEACLCQVIFCQEHGEKTFASIRVETDEVCDEEQTEHDNEEKSRDCECWF